MEWVELAARWLHVITAIAWIGSSFYFIALDLGLRPVSDPGAGIHGEGRQVQGGGFYRIQKYFIAPARLPQEVTWFKWECYATWLTGFVMVVLVYYLGAELFMIDPSILDIPAWAGVVIPIGSLVFGWIVFDLICNRRFGNDNTRLTFGLYVILVVMAGCIARCSPGGRHCCIWVHLPRPSCRPMCLWSSFQTRKSWLPIWVRRKQQRQKYGKIAKQRPTHNTYLTQPVLFLILSNHYALAFASEYNWAIALLVFLMGVTSGISLIRSTRKGSPW